MLREFGEFSLPPNFHITYTTMKNIIQANKLIYIYKSLINIIQENNWVITTKKGKGKLPLFYGNRELEIPIYAWGERKYCWSPPPTWGRRVSVKWYMPYVLVV